MQRSKQQFFFALVLMLPVASMSVEEKRIYQTDQYGNMALRRFHTVDIRVAEAGAGTLA